VPLVGREPLDVRGGQRGGVVAAGRVGGHYRPYFAVRDAVDVALDRADLDTARRLLTDLETHATALDVTAGTTTYTAETAELRRRLTELETGAGAP